MEYFFIGLIIYYVVGVFYMISEWRNQGFSVTVEDLLFILSLAWLIFPLVIIEKVLKKFINFNKVIIERKDNDNDK